MATEPPDKPPTSIRNPESHPPTLGVSVVYAPLDTRPAGLKTDVMSSQNRTDLLANAERLVNGDRDDQYGDPISDFRTTADMWSAYLERRLGAPVRLLPHDVAALMMCLKLSRISWLPEHEDNWADLAGYSACGWDCVLREDGTAPAASTPVKVDYSNWAV